MYRRSFIKKIMALGSLLFIPKILKAQMKEIQDQSELVSELKKVTNLKEFLVLLERLSAVEKNLKIESTWSIGTVLSHCAQSIRYSIDGYPDMKSAFFRNTVGSLAFSIFSMRGKMNHGLEEPIPGATPIDLNTIFSVGKEELIEAINLFQKKTTEDLKPHFAYGELSREDYENAHLFHIKNHFERISLT
ncbi:MAG: DUF1569 domain-containing protein [Leptospira sp.]|nr:DUF1569 domain-containing protein [Leptospira sp.]